MAPNNNYKPNNNRRYNNKPNYRRYNNRPNNGPQNKKGILSFLFSVEGKISKELFTPLYLLIVAGVLIFSKFAIDFKTDTAQTIASIILLTLSWIGFAISYKRAHSLGISGIYSILGTVLFTPFFAFYKPGRDFANDGFYKNKFIFIKKIGAFFQRTAATKIIYMLILGFLYTINHLGKETELEKSIIKFILIILTFNIVQIFLVKKPLKIYVNIVKVVSFISFILLIIYASMIGTLISMQQQGMLIPM